ncbi:MAG: hypothetical protein WBX38_07020 [Candidatus Sulfotelmatobacter sp.]
MPKVTSSWRQKRSHRDPHYLPLLAGLPVNLPKPKASNFPALAGFDLV